VRDERAEPCAIRLVRGQGDAVVTLLYLHVLILPSDRFERPTPGPHAENGDDQRLHDEDQADQADDAGLTR
jgi:hypothetical protein